MGMHPNPVFNGIFDEILARIWRPGRQVRDAGINITVRQRFETNSANN